MFSAVRKRATYANVAATLALVFAMSGGAYAASKVIIHSLNQISPAVQKKLRGKAGAMGSAGPAGTAGTAGAEGKQGKEGKPGEKGIEGKPGEKGVEGSPWTAGGVLPSKKTETGTWGYGFMAKNPGQHFTIQINFALPLSSVLDEAHVHYILQNGEELNAAEEEVAPIGCEGGSAAEPKAAPGNLCVYTGHETGAHQLITSASIQNPAERTEVLGAATSGAVITGPIFVEGGTAFGTWAVTAP